MGAWAPSGTSGGSISLEAAALLRRMHEGHRPTAGPCVTELVTHGLVVHDPHSGTYVAAELSDVARNLTRSTNAQIADTLRYAEQLSELIIDVSATARPNGAGVQRIDHLDDVTAMLAQAVAEADFVRTSQPVPRPANRLRGALLRDAEIARRGARLHVLYLETARTRAPEQEYARGVSQHGAKVRTMDPPFERIILADSVAFISDRSGEQSGYPALRITNSGLVAFIASVYEQQWANARPWMGEAPTRPEGVTPRHHFVLRRLLHGRTLKSVALELGVSTSTLYADLDRLYSLTGVEGQFALGAWYSAAYGPAGTG